MHIFNIRVFRDKRYKCQNLLGEHKIIVTFKNFTIPEKYDISDILIIDISQWIERTNSIEKEISNFNLLNRSKSHVISYRQITLSFHIFTKCLSNFPDEIG